MNIRKNNSKKTKNNKKQTTLVGEKELKAVSVKSSREISIDIARGLTIFIMIMTHVIAVVFAYGEKNRVIYNIGLFGGIVSFTSFLFISGISSYLGYLKSTSEISEENVVSVGALNTKLLRRTLYIVLTYYLLATIVLFVDRTYTLPVSSDWIDVTLKTITFLNLEEFTEFLITLAGFSLSLLVFRRFYIFILRHKILGIVLSVLSFVAGFLLYSVNFDIKILNQCKALFAGGEGLHTFPFLQYFPIFLLGLYFGKYIGQRRRFSLKIIASLVILVIFISGLIASQLLYNHYGRTEFYSLPEKGRFPPTFGFLCLSGAFTMIILLICLLFSRLLKAKLYSWITFAGKNALLFFLFHVMILLAFREVTRHEGKFYNTRFSDTLEILGIFFAVSALSFMLALFYKAFFNRVRVPSAQIERFISLSFVALLAVLLSLNIYSAITALEPSQHNSNVSYSRVFGFSGNGPQVSDVVKLSTSRKWFLKSPNSNYPQELEFTISLDPEKVSDNVIVLYSINGVNYKETKELEVTDKSNISSKISLVNYPTGTYSITGVILDIDNNFALDFSNPVNFYVSYPLYVAWTIDWEGWDVAEYDLNNIASVSDQYKIPMTHFFNPRIYTKEQNFYATISPERADYLTRWVNNRYLYNGDEIGMHIHMFPDMLKEIGVTVRPNAVAVGAMYGDTLISAYSSDEMTKVLSWGKAKFQEKGLPDPTSFRAGGWMASNDLMIALENTGFLIDSSGRTGGNINPALSYSTLVPWTLTETTRPYLISRSSINSWEGDRFNIWEFPNNGADSYWFSDADLKHRLDVNFSTPEKVMNYPQVLTYLSHPHWFTGVDINKIKATFDYTQTFSYQNDSGPIVYSTLRNAYNEWDKTNFTNGN